MRCYSEYGISSKLASISSLNLTHHTPARIFVLTLFSSKHIRKTSAKFYALLYITLQVLAQRAGRSMKRDEGNYFLCTDGREVQVVLLFELFLHWRVPPYFSRAWKVEGTSFFSFSNFNCISTPITLAPGVSIEKVYMYITSSFDVQFVSISRVSYIHQNLRFYRALLMKFDVAKLSRSLKLKMEYVRELINKVPGKTP